jgi:superfamily II DNA or RNA helicase
MIPTNITYFSNNWKPLAAKLPEVADETPKELGYGGRTYQTKCYKQFKDKRLTLLISPTGSGKSLKIGRAHV